MRRLSLVLLVFQLSACATLFPQRPAPVDVEAGADFHTILAAEYHNLAAFAGEEMGDKDAAENFQRKSVAAAAGQPVFPANPDSADLPAPLQGDLVRAHEILTDALAHLSAPQNNALLAMAQSHYDCWFFTATHYHTGRTDFPCRNDFEQSVERLSLPENDTFHFDIKFPDGMASMAGTEMTAVHAAADHYSDRALWTIVLSSYADGRKPGRESSTNLTMRRAIAVKNALAQQGIGDERVLIQVGPAPEEAPGLAGSVVIDFIPDYTEEGLDLHSRPAPGWDHSGSDL